jgi:hypothetical protein
MYSIPPPNFIYCSYKVTVQFADDLGNNKSCRGTGFFVATADNKVAFITNRHVLDAGYKKPLTDKSMRLIKHNILGKTRQGDTYELLVDPNQAPVFPLNYADDIACIVDPRCSSTPPNADIFHHFGIEALADEHLFSDGLYPGEQVFYAGFPDPHDKLAQRPLLRSGTVASDPKYPYSNTGEDEGARVAYEAFSSGGASGSPVWAAARSFKDYPGSRTGAVVGVNAGHIEGSFGAHSGISFFYKSSIVLQLLRNSGLSTGAP